MDVSGGGGGGDRGGAVALALLGSRRGWAADASACAARLWPRAAWGRQQHLLCLACLWVGPLTRWLASDGASRGGGAVLALLCLRQGRAANASACPTCLRPRAEVRGEQQLLPVAVLALQLYNL